MSDERIEELEATLRALLRWLRAPGDCPDCDTFRTAPSSIDFLHHEQCDVLEEVNKALGVLGKTPITDTHNFEDPKAEMRRLANERAVLYNRTLRRPK